MTDTIGQAREPEAQEKGGIAFARASGLCTGEFRTLTQELGTLLAVRATVSMVIAARAAA
jgi:hypothetical protein